MLLRNIDSSICLVNGRIGTIIDIFDKGKNTSNFPILIIKFTKLSDEYNDLTVEIIRQLLCEVDLPNGSMVSFYQYPIKLCYGVTAHKVQGQTLKKVAINISKNAFTHHIALSRVRTLNDIILFGPETFPEDGPSFHKVNWFIQ